MEALSQAQEEVAKKRGFGTWDNLQRSFHNKGREVSGGILKEVATIEKRLKRRLNS